MYHGDNAEVYHDDNDDKGDDYGDCGNYNDDNWDYYDDDNDYYNDNDANEQYDNEDDQTSYGNDYDNYQESDGIEKLQELSLFSNNIFNTSSHTLQYHIQSICMSSLYQLSTFKSLSSLTSSSILTIQHCIWDRGKHTKYNTIFKTYYKYLQYLIFHISDRLILWAVQKIPVPVDICWQRISLFMLLILFDIYGIIFLFLYDQNPQLLIMGRVL